jgi:hypothetical protein
VVHRAPQRRVQHTGRRTRAVDHHTRRRQRRRTGVERGECRVVVWCLLA